MLTNKYNTLTISYLKINNKKSWYLTILFNYLCIAKQEKKSMRIYHNILSFTDKQDCLFVIYNRRRFR